ncbi:uncharacterized protein LOC129615691 [Condylostylus longicornis]|uniref:uncharacterized protein LOC129615691 n=1 Tax=Condylostylus longicornis TaxID=2530218 RepID=UPI00244E0BEE|nr:uncharacterized protein LOC129615691 [Condylostylus longicornis]
MQYRLPTQSFDIVQLYKLIFWYSNEEKKKRSLTYDISRKYIYKIIEVILDKMGYDGKNCLLKLICEIAREPIHGNSMIYQILNTILSPLNGSIDDDYLEAKRAGLQWANCSSCFYKCINFNLLEKFSIYL